MIRALTLTLALLIAVTSQQMAMARGVMYDAAGQVVLCTGQGTQTVTVDHSGNPIEVVHICPDCALTLVAAVATQATTQPTVVHIQILAQTAVQDFKSVLIPNITSARDPPAFV